MDKIHENMIFLCFHVNFIHKSTKLPFSAYFSPNGFVVEKGLHIKSQKYACFYAFSSGNGSIAIRHYMRKYK